MHPVIQFVVDQTGKLLHVCRSFIIRQRIAPRFAGLDPVPFRHHPKASKALCHPRVRAMIEDDTLPTLTAETLLTLDDAVLDVLLTAEAQAFIQAKYLTEAHYQALTAARLKALSVHAVQTLIDRGVIPLDRFFTLTDDSCHALRVPGVRALLEGDAAITLAEFTALQENPTAHRTLLDTTLWTPYTPAQCIQRGLITQQELIELGQADNTDAADNALRQPAVRRLLQRKQLTMEEVVSFKNTQWNALTHRYMRRLIQHRHLNAESLMTLLPRTIEALAHAPTRRLLEQGMLSVAELNACSAHALQALRHPGIRRLIREGHLRTETLTSPHFDEDALRVIQDRGARLRIRDGYVCIPNPFDQHESAYSAQSRRTEKADKPLPRKIFNKPWVKHLIRSRWASPADMHLHLVERRPSTLLTVLSSARVRRLIKRRNLSLDQVTDAIHGLSGDTVVTDALATLTAIDTARQNHLASPAVRHLIRDGYFSSAEAHRLPDIVLDALADRSHRHTLAWLIRHRYISKHTCTQLEPEVLAALGTPHTSQLIRHRYSAGAHAHLSPHTLVNVPLHAVPLLLEAPEQSLIHQQLLTTTDLHEIPPVTVEVLQQPGPRSLLSASPQRGHITIAEIRLLSQQACTALSDPGVRSLIRHWLSPADLARFRETAQVELLTNKHIQQLLAEGCITCDELVAEHSTLDLNRLTNDEAYRSTIRTARQTVCTEAGRRVIGSGTEALVGTRLSPDEARQLSDEARTLLRKTRRAGRLHSRSAPGLLITPDREDDEIRHDGSLTSEEKAMELLRHHYVRPLNDNTPHTLLDELHGQVLRIEDDATREAACQTMIDIKSSSRDCVAHDPHRLTPAERLALLFLAIKANPDAEETSPLIESLAAAFLSAQQQYPRRARTLLSQRHRCRFQLAAAFNAMKPHIPELTPREPSASSLW